MDIRLFDEKGRYIPPPDEVLDECSPEVRAAILEVEAAANELVVIDAKIEEATNKVRAGVAAVRDAQQYIKDNPQLRPSQVEVTKAWIASERQQQFR